MQVKKSGVFILFEIEWATNINYLEVPTNFTFFRIKAYLFKRRQGKRALTYLINYVNIYHS